jgi:hypothetical protein
MSNVLILAVGALVIVLLITVIPSVIRGSRSVVAESGSVLSNPTFIIFAVSAAIGGVAWSIKQLIDSLRLRTEMAILETLSDGNPRTHGDIIKEVREKHSDKQSYSNLPIIRGSITDALASLVSGRKVLIENGMYVIERSGEHSKKPAT